MTIVNLKLQRIQKRLDLNHLQVTIKSTNFSQKNTFCFVFYGITLKTYLKQHTVSMRKT